MTLGKRRIQITEDEERRLAEARRIALSPAEAAKAVNPAEVSPPSSTQPRDLRSRALE